MLDAVGYSREKDAPIADSAITNQPLDCRFFNYRLPVHCRLAIAKSHIARLPDSHIADRP